MASGNDFYDDIYLDILEENPTYPIIMPLPYNENSSLVSNVEQMFQYLLRALRRKDRILSLVNAYYIGQVLDERPKKPSERTSCYHVLTAHYITTCTRIYTIFSILGVEQLYRSKRMKVAYFKKISAKEVRKLTEEATNKFSQELDN